MNKTLGNAIKTLSVLAMIHAGYALLKYDIFAWHIVVISAFLWSWGNAIKKADA